MADESSVVRGRTSKVRCRRWIWLLAVGVAIPGITIVGGNCVLSALAVTTDKQTRAARVELNPIPPLPAAQTESGHVKTLQAVVELRRLESQCIEVVASVLPAVVGMMPPSKARLPKPGPHARGGSGIIITPEGLVRSQWHESTRNAVASASMHGYAASDYALFLKAPLRTVCEANEKDGSSKYADAWHFTEFTCGEDKLPVDKQVPKSYPVLSGVGLALVSKDGHIVVGKLIPKTPAAESGRIPEGSRIVSIEVDGKDMDVEGKTVGDVVSLIRGPVGTKLVLGILSPGADVPMKVTLARAPLEIEGVADSTYKRFIGKPMTKVSFSSLDGSDSETLADHRGKVVVLDFWASWCPACYQPVTKLQEMVADNPDWKGKVEVIAVTVDAEVDKALAVVKEKGWNKTRHRAANHDQLKESGISVVPVVVIVATDGKIAAMAGSHALDIENEVERLLSVGPAPEPSDRP